MRLFMAGLLGAALLIAAAPATAFDDEDGAESSRDQVLCRRMEPRVGTRIGTRRICKTQAEWDALDRASRREMEQIQQRGSREIPSQRGDDDAGPL